MPKPTRRELGGVSGRPLVFFAIDRAHTADHSHGELLMLGIAVLHLENLYAKFYVDPPSSASRARRSTARLAHPPQARRHHRGRDDRQPAAGAFPPEFKVGYMFTMAQVYPSYGDFYRERKDSLCRHQRVIASNGEGLGEK